VCLAIERDGTLYRVATAGNAVAREAKSFFSEEKKQKTFIFGAGGSLPAMAGNVGAAEN
jgi:hypothetical protein